MKPADIAHLVTLGAPALSPDGRWAVVAASRPDLDADEYRSSLWLVPTDGSAAPRRLTHGPRDSAPAYAPDGRHLAFLRASGKDKPQLHLLPTGGGDGHAITELPGGAGDPRWSPDSRSIAFTARVPEAGRYGQDESVPAEKEPPRRITGLQYRRDDVGFLVDRRSHVFVLDLDAAAELDSTGPRQLTDGDQDDTDVTWSPDGTRLAFVSARHAGRDHDRCTDVFEIGRDGTGLRQLTDSSLMLTAPAYCAAGVLALGTEHPGDGGSWIGRNTGVWLIGAPDSGPARPARLTDEETAHVGGDRIVVDGTQALVLVESRGAMDLVTVSTDDATGTAPVAGERQITAVARAAGVTVASYVDPTTGGELGRVGATPDGSGIVALTDFATDVREHTVPISAITAAAPDGYPVHGFLAVPPGAGPHPVLLMIHGGPFTQYGWKLFDEAQVYAGAGYAVVYGNPRGSSGYGQAHGQWIIGDVGARSTPDLLALLDAALERADLDAERVGVLGGSHGGYMTTWLIAHTNRFRAAVSERAVNAIDSFEGSSDIGWDFADNLYGTDPDRRHVQSPLTYADAIETPLLIIHSEHDWRCPVEQAQRLFVTLRKRGVQTELLLFPGEGHEMSRNGTPRHRVARFEAILDWFDRHV